MKTYNFSAVIILFLALLLTSMACRLGANQPQQPLETIPVSTQAVATLEQKMKDAADQAAQGNTIELTISEEEITSLVVLRMEGAQSEMAFSDLQVFLRDGTIQIYGNVQTGELIIPAQAVFEPQVDTNGQVRVNLVSLSLASVSAPDAVKELVQEQVGKPMTDLIQESSGTFFVESVTIEAGTLTLRGYRP